MRGFDAAARHLSFTGAAAELGLTQGAVSRQVKALEEDLGQPLFRRLTRRIVLTPEGAAFHRTVEEALALLAEGAGRLRGGPPRRLTLSALPTIASAWLMPRLDGFARRHPGLEVRLLSSIEPVSLAGGGGPAIRVGRLPGQPQHRLAPRIELEMVRDWRGLEAMPFLPDVLVPVCRAEWLPNGPLEPAALAALPLIQVSTRRHAGRTGCAPRVCARPRSACKAAFPSAISSWRWKRRGRGRAWRWCRTSCCPATFHRKDWPWPARRVSPAREAMCCCGRTAAKERGRSMRCMAGCWRKRGRA
ncbi:LysR family transcriptional regulator [Teichococcus aestuarii]|uniref:LysR family transcriptional regulator n=1 Tax=Teichococcus aestuarii TaxID=568898 RepID=UPI00360DADFE